MMEAVLLHHINLYGIADQEIHSLKLLDSPHHIHS